VVLGNELYEIKPQKLRLQIRNIHCESGRQNIWQVSSQSPVVGLRHVVHYYVVWVYIEARTVLRAMVADFPSTVGIF
jgi:hypothetical protein